MGKGRRPLPRATKALKGSLKKCRDKKAAPKPPAEWPKYPRGLTREEKGLWRWLKKFIDPLRVTAPSDVATLKLLVRALARWERAVEEVAGRGEYYESEGRDGILTIKLHPAVPVAAQCEKFILRTLIEFGLTPAARQKVSARPKEEETPRGKILAFANRRRHASG